MSGSGAISPYFPAGELARTAQKGVQIQGAHGSLPRGHPEEPLEMKLKLAPDLPNTAIWPDPLGARMGLQKGAQNGCSKWAILAPKWA